MKNEQAEKATRAVSDFVNNMSNNEQAFVEAFAREHRTLQQSFTGLCLAWLAHLAQLNEGEYDGRNEASVQRAKLIAEKAGPYGLAGLPLI
jgi:hypothetical protein